MRYHEVMSAPALTGVVDVDLAGGSGLRRPMGPRAQDDKRSARFAGLCSRQLSTYADTASVVPF